MARVLSDPGDGHTDYEDNDGFRARSRSETRSDGPGSIPTSSTSYSALSIRVSPPPPLTALSTYWRDSGLVSPQLAVCPRPTSYFSGSSGPISEPPARTPELLICDGRSRTARRSRPARNDGSERSCRGACPGSRDPARVVSTSPPSNRLGAGSAQRPCPPQPDRAGEVQGSSRR